MIVYYLLFIYDHILDLQVFFNLFTINLTRQLHIKDNYFNEIIRI